jgi:effector-binding domain-containing protein
MKDLSTTFHRSDRMFRIGEFARLNRVSAKLLRHYDEIGLLKPEQIDEYTGYRNYSAAQIPILNRIIAFKDLGFSLTEISNLLRDNLSSEEMIGILKSRKVQIEKVIGDERSRLDRVEKLITLFNQEVESMNYDVVIKKVDSFRVASLRGSMKDYGDQGNMWEELVTHIEKHNAKILPGCFVSFYGELDEKGIEAEVFEPIDRDIPSSDRVKVHYMPTVEKMACLVQQGPYENLKLAYAAITGWIEDNGYRIIGSEREIYLKGEWNSDSPDEYVTEIQFPVEKAS